MYHIGDDQAASRPEALMTHMSVDMAEKNTIEGTAVLTTADEAIVKAQLKTGTIWPHTPTFKNATQTKHRANRATTVKVNFSGMVSNGYLASAKKPISILCKRT